MILSSAAGLNTPTLSLRLKVYMNITPLTSRDYFVRVWCYATEKKKNKKNNPQQTAAPL